MTKKNRRMSKSTRPRRWTVDEALAQLDKLDRMFGVGENALKERTKLQKVLDDAGVTR